MSQKTKHLLLVASQSMLRAYANSALTLFHQHDWGLLSVPKENLIHCHLVCRNPHACWRWVVFPQLLCPDLHGLALVGQMTSGL